MLLPAEVLSLTLSLSTLGLSPRNTSFHAKILGTKNRYLLRLIFYCIDGAFDQLLKVENAHQAFLISRDLSN